MILFDAGRRSSHNLGLLIWLIDPTMSNIFLKEPLVHNYINILIDYSKQMYVFPCNPYPMYLN